MPAHRFDRFALSQFTTRASFADDVRLCRSLGIAAIEVCENKLSDDAARAADELLELRDSGLRVTSVQGRVHALFPDQMAPTPDEATRRIDAMVRTMDRFATALPGESPAYVFIGGRAPRHDLAFAREMLVEQSLRLADEAAARGMRIAFEPLHPVMMNEDSFVCSWDEAVTLAGAIDTPSFGLVCDLWNVWDQPNILERVQENLHQVEMVHVSDWRSGGPRRLNDRLVPGRGIIPFDAWGRMFREAEFDGWIGLEMLSDESLDDSYLKEPVETVIEESRRHLHESGCLATLSP